jgi:two-component system, OmpR family, catabolic regulation response regulator CreB
MGSILLVEADTITSETWSAAITACGHAVLTAGGMREALMTVRDGGIDVVVIDAHDPRAGVVELAHGMNALPDTPPIILVSESPAAPWLSVRIGAATFVAKPCDPEEVVAAISRLLRVRPAYFLEDELRLPVRQLE